MTAPRTHLPMLQDLRIASPCSASWEEMLPVPDLSGGEPSGARIRFCLACEKNVYDLSAMTAAEGEALLRAHAGGEVCVRFWQRADGTVMTSDCPVGVSRKRRKKLALAVAGAGALAAAALRVETAAAGPPIGREPASFTATHDVTPMSGSNLSRAPRAPATTGNPGPASHVPSYPHRPMGAVAVPRVP